MNKNFLGIIPAMMTPFDNNQKVDEVAIEKLLDYLINMGVHGVYLTGSTGEGLSMDIEERNDVVRKVCEYVDARITVIAHTGAISTQQSIALSHAAADAGVDAISAIPPFYYNFSQDEIIEHYKNIAESTALPLLVYNIPSTTGLNLSIKILEQLLGIKNIIGLKYTHSDIFTLERIKNLDPAPIVFSGSDEMSFYGLWAGADGLVGSSYNLLVDITVAMYHTFMKKDYSLAHTYYLVASEILFELLQYPYFSAVREVMKWISVDIGSPRKPFNAINPEQSKTLRSKIKSVLKKHPEVDTVLRNI